MAESLSDEKYCRIFLERDEFTDLVIRTSDQQLYAHQILLANASLVLKDAFFGHGKAKERFTELPLPQYSCGDILEVLCCLYPSIRRRIYEKNVMQVLPIAFQLQIRTLLVECEDLLLIKVQRVSARRILLDYIYIAQQYNLCRLFDRAAKKLAKFSIADLLLMNSSTNANVPNGSNKNDQHHAAGLQDLQCKWLSAVLRHRVEYLEKQSETADQNLRKWQGKAERLEVELGSCRGEGEEQLGRTRAVVAEVVGLVEQVVACWRAGRNEARCLRHAQLGLAAFLGLPDPQAPAGQTATVADPRRPLECAECAQIVCCYFERRLPELIASLTT